MVGAPGNRHHHEDTGSSVHYAQPGRYRQLLAPSFLLYQFIDALLHMKIKVTHTRDMRGPQRQVETHDNVIEALLVPFQGIDRHYTFLVVLALVIQGIRRILRLAESHIPVVVHEAVKHVEQLTVDLFYRACVGVLFYCRCC
jgi:hypothetical protein